MKQIFKMNSNFSINCGRYHLGDILQELEETNCITVSYYIDTAKILPSGVLYFHQRLKQIIFGDGVNLKDGLQIVKVNVYLKKGGYIMKIQPLTKSFFIEE